jgi:hypothetical protein
MVLIALAATPAASRAPAPGGGPGSKIIDSVLACRTITDAQQRLACFDANAQSLQMATTQHDIVVVDRDEVRQERRSLFGFDIQGLRIFGSDDHDKSSAEKEDDQITSTVRSAKTDGDGNLIIVLEDGAIWHQTDGTPLGKDPKPGMTVTIRRGALGSYFIKIGNQPGIKARRQG